MAEEKVELFEITINTSEALKDLASSQRSVDALKGAIKDLQKAEGDNSEELASLNANLKIQQKEMRTNQKIVQSVEEANRSQTGSINEMRAQLATTTIQWARLSEEERNNTEEGQALVKQKLELTEALKKEEKATGDTRRNVGNYSDGILDAVGALDSFIPGAGGAGAAAKQLGANMSLALGPVGLIITAIGLIVTAFTTFINSTQEGQDIFKKFSLALEVGLDIITGLLAGLGKAFLAPKEALQDFRDFVDDTLGKIIVGSIKSAMANILKIFRRIGLAWEELKNVFVDNADGIAEANAKVKDASEKVDRANAMVLEGVENTIDAYDDLKEAIIEVVAEGKKQIEQANILLAAQIRYEEALIATTTALAKLNAEAEKQSDIADDATLSFAKRKKAEDAAREASEKSAAISLDLAQQELAMLQIQNAQLAKNGLLLRENKQEEADLVAAVIQAESTLTNVRFENSKRRREIANAEFNLNLDYLIDNFDNIKSVNERIIADENKTLADRKGIIDATRKLSETAFKEQIAELQTRTEAEINANELIGESDTRRLLERIRLLELGENEETRLLEVIRERRTVLQDLADAEIEINQQVLDAKQEAALIDLENKLANTELELFGKLEIERQALEMQYEQEIAAAKKVGADTTLIEKKFSDARNAINKAEFKAKLALAGGFADNIAQIAGEQTAIGKAAAVASTTISTIQGAQASFTGMVQSIPGPVGVALGAVAAAAALYSGYENVKSILAVKSGLPGDSGSGGGSGGGGGGSVPSVPTTSARATAVEDVGAGIISRDSANIGGGDDLSVQPTLVTDEVTVSQNEELANNETATI